MVEHFLRTLWLRESILNHSGTHHTFNNCVPVFSSGNVIHVMPDNLASSFTTVDAQDYSTISTFDLKREIHSFSSNYDSTQLVLTANLKTADSSIVYIYDLYRLKLMANKGPGEERNQFLNGICADSDVSSSQQSTLSSDSTESYWVESVLYVDSHLQ